MFLTDDHLHSLFSADGKETMESICETAIEKGLSEIALTDHMDIHTELLFSEIMDCENWYKSLMDVKEKYKGKLLVHSGIELGQPQCNSDQAKAFLDTYPLDFILGSIHCMEDNLDVYYYDFEEKDPDAVCAQYVEWLKDLACGFDFDVMGHITYPSRYILEQTGKLPDISVLRDCYKDLFELIIPSGHGIELNVSGIARGNGPIMPDMDLLKLYRQCGGEIITIGSDAHRKEHVGTVSKIGQEILKEAGFEYVTYYEERKPKFVKL